MVALFNGSPDRPATAQNRSPSRGTEPAGDRGRLEERRAERGPSPADAPASPGTTEDEVQATFLMGSEAELGQAIFEVVDARVLPGPEMALLLRVRVRNETAYDLHLHGGQFRLVQGDDVRPPENFLSEVVPTETAKEATVSFERISAAGDVALRIVHSGETAEIPLDLSGRRGATAAADREARRAGRTTFPVAVDSAFALMRFGDLAAELREATVRRYAHKLTLALTVRVHNRSRYDAAVGDDQFRLVVNGLPRGPVRRFQQIVRSDESGECRVVFDVPFDSPEVVLRTRFREQVAEIPLQIPPAAVPPGRVQRAAGR
jgi:hypothetical protein